MRGNLIGIAVLVSLPLLECCEAIAQASSLPIVRCEGGLIAGGLVRVLVGVVRHLSSSDLGNEGLDNLRDILAQKLCLL